MPADWMIVAIPETSRSALTRVAICVRVQPDRRSDDQRHRDRARVHDAQVLQAEDEQLVQRGDAVHGMWAGGRRGAVRPRGRLV